MAIIDQTHEHGENIRAGCRAQTQKLGRRPLSPHCFLELDIKWVQGMALIETSRHCRHRGE